MSRERGKYTPSSEHRFVLSSDPISQQRYQALLRAHRDLVAGIPFFVGIVLAGSLSKGRVLGPQTDADVDVHGFVDIDELLTQKVALIAGSTEFAVNFRSSLRILAEVRKQIGEQEEQGTFLAVAKSHLERGVAEAFRARWVGLSGDHLALTFPDRAPKIDAQIYPISFDSNSDYSLYQMVRQHEVNIISGFEKQSKDGFILGKAFGWDLEGCLRPYRQSFFDELEMRSDKKALWKLVNRTVTYAERRYKGGKIPKRLGPFYPETFEEAKAYYLKG